MSHVQLNMVRHVDTKSLIGNKRLNLNLKNVIPPSVLTEADRFEKMRIRLLLGGSRFNYLENET